MFLKCCEISLGDFLGAYFPRLLLSAAVVSLIHLFSLSSLLIVF